MRGQAQRTTSSRASAQQAPKARAQCAGKRSATKERKQRHDSSAGLKKSLGALAKSSQRSSWAGEASTATSRPSGLTLIACRTEVCNRAAKTCQEGAHANTQAEKSANNATQEPWSERTIVAAAGHAKPSLFRPTLQATTRSQAHPTDRKRHLQGSARNLRARRKAVVTRSGTREVHTATKNAMHSSAKPAKRPRHQPTCTSARHPRADSDPNFCRTWRHKGRCSLQAECKCHPATTSGEDKQKQAQGKATRTEPTLQPRGHAAE